MAENLVSSDASPEIYLSDRLVVQHDCLDKLSLLFEQLQVVTVEASDPCLDLLAFSQDAYYFAVIMKKIKLPPTEPTEAQEQKVTDKENQVNNAPSVPKGRHIPCGPVKPSRNSQSSKADILYKSHESIDPHVNAARPDSESPWTNGATSWTATGEAVGLVYLYDLAKFTDPLRHGELNVGIILDPAHRGKGYAAQALHMVLEEAFSTAQWHRVQAILPNHVDKYHAIRLFTQMGFDHEGTRRHAFFSPMENVYKDVTYLGMLDTQWIVRSRTALSSAPKSVWDELFTRHMREREELLNWKDGLRRVQTHTQRNFKPVELSEGLDAAKGRFIEGESVNPRQCVKDTASNSGYESDDSTTFGSMSVSSAASLAGFESTTSEPSWDVV